MESIVILGCGIYGISIAYHLALAGVGRSVTVIDVADGPFAGASGRPTAFLSNNSVHDADLEALVQYSMAMHHDLAERFDGANRWQYQNVTSYDADQDAVASRWPSEKIRRDRPPGFSWLAEKEPWTDVSWSSPKQYASTDPAALGGFLLDAASARGVKFLFGSQVSKVFAKNGRDVTSLLVKRRTKGCAGDFELACDRLVIATGPWTSRVFEKLFPTARTRVPVSADTGSYSMLLRVGTQNGFQPEWLNKSVVLRSDQPSLQLMVRKDGTIHAATTPPDTIVFPHPPAEMRTWGTVGNLPLLEGGVRSLLSVPSEIIDRRPCFSPTTPTGLPVMSRVSSCHLRGSFGATTDDAESGVYIIAGHGYWGITAALGSGKLVAQLLLGIEPDIDLDKFRLHDDALVEHRPLIEWGLDSLFHAFAALTSLWTSCLPWRSSSSAYRGGFGGDEKKPTSHDYQARA